MCVCEREREGEREGEREREREREYESVLCVIHGNKVLRPCPIFVAYKQYAYLHLRLFSGNNMFHTHAIYS